MALQKIGVEAVIEGLSSFRRGIDGMGNDVGGFGDKVGGVGSQLAGFGDKLTTIGTIAAGAVVAGLAAATTAVVAFAGKGVVAAKDMEQSLADIAAVLNTTKDEIQPLSDLIVELGLDPNLKVTAEEAAAAIELLARNGLSMTEIVDGAARSTVLLANATGADFGNAANIATDAMAIFGIEAANMGDAVNGIVSVTTNSKFSINDYALALAQGGGVAAAAGVEFDDFNAAIAAISPLFRSGSDAGTSMKTMLTRLTPASSKAEEAMYDLGIITEDGANRFFTATGELKDMAEIAEIMQGALSGLSEEQKAQALSTIFGSDAMRAAVGLAEVGGEAFQELADAMGETDAASQAATRMDTLAGTLEVIEGVIETVQLQIGQAFLPLLRQLAEWLLVIADQVGPVVTEFFDNVANYIGIFVDEVTNGEGPLAGFMNVLREMGVSEDVRTQIYDTVTAISDFIAKVSEFVSEHSQAFKDAFIGIGAVLAGSVILSVLGTIASLLASFVLPIALIGVVVAGLAKLWRDNFGGIQELTESVFDAVKKAWDGFKKLFKGDFKGFGKDIEEAWSIAWDAVVEFVGNIWEMVKPKLEAFWTSITDWFGGIDWQQLAVTAVDRLITGFGELGARVGEIAGNLVVTITDWINSIDWQSVGSTIMTAIGTALAGAVGLISIGLQALWSFIKGEAGAQDWGEIGLNILTAVFNALSGFVSGVGEVLAGWWQAFVNWVQGVDWQQIGLNIITPIITGLGEFVTNVGETLTGWWQSFVDWFNNIDWFQLGYDIAYTVVTGLENFKIIVTETLVSWWNSFFSWFNEQNWQTLSDTTTDGIVEGLKLFWEKAKVVVAGWWVSIKEWFNSINWSELGSNIIDGIVSGLMNSAFKIFEAIAGIVTGGLRAGQDAAEVGSPSKLAARLIGTPITEGIAVGIDQPNIIDSAIGNLFSQAIPQTTAAMQPVTNSFGGATNVDNGRSVDVSFGDTINNTPFDVVIFQEFILNTVRDAVDL